MRSILVAAVAIAGLWSFLGCATSPAAHGFPNKQAILGKTKQTVLACAGEPVRIITRDEGVLLMYYKEATLFEESFSTSKSSHPGIHHGCWASVLLKEDRVTDVEYRSVPSFVDALDECEEIFRACGA